MGLRHVRGRALRRAAVGIRRDRVRVRRVGPVVDVDDTLFRHFETGFEQYLYCYIVAKIKAHVRMRFFVRSKRSDYWHSIL